MDNYILLPAVVEVEFSSPMYTVDEGNGTVTLCLTTDIGIAQPLQVDVIPTQKATGNIATGMYAVLVHFPVYCLAEPYKNHATKFKITQENNVKG